MKRSIICKPCSFKHPLKQYDGEWAKRIRGFALHNFYCDLCNVTIQKGARCCAESNGLNSQAYYPWESEFIKRDTI